MNTLSLIRIKFDKDLSIFFIKIQLQYLKTEKTSGFIPEAFFFTGH